MREAGVGFEKGGGGQAPAGRGAWRAFKDLVGASPELRRSLVPYIALMCAAKASAAVAAAAVAAALGGSGWASDLMGAGAGLCAWFASCRFLEMLFELARNVMFAKVGSAAEESLSEPAFERALAGGPGEAGSPAELARRVEDQSARNFMAFMFTHLGSTAGDLVAVSVLSVSIGAGWRFAWVAPLCAAVFWLGWKGMGWSSRAKAGYDELGAYAKAMARSGEMLSKAALAKAYGSEALYMRLRREASEAHRKERAAWAGSGVWILQASPALAAMSMAAMFALGADGHDSGRQAAAAFAAAIAALTAAFSRAQQMTFAFEGLGSSLRDLDRSLDCARDGALAALAPELPGAFQGELAVRGLVAHRPGLPRPALSIDALSVRAGEVLWVVGGSGSGKSTLLGAVMGTLPYGAGSLLWNGRPLGAWARLGAFAPQSSRPAPGTVGWNLRLGRGEASDQDLWDALDRVGMRGRIGLGGGLVADLSAMGLSGGEAQRVSIARALVAKRPLAAFDEPTSGLDAKNEAMAVRAIQELAAAGAAVLVANHRLFAIPAGSRVLCMREGLVAEEGSFEELAAAGGEFSKLLWHARNRGGDGEGDGAEAGGASLNAGAEGGPPPGAQALAGGRA